MRVALLGGTGDIGEGLALRLARDSDHAIRIGSRDPSKAERAATEYEETLADAGVDATIDGVGNATAADAADVCILSVPPHYVSDTVDAVADNLDDGSVLVSPAVGMDRDEAGFHYAPPPTGSVTEHAAEAAPEDVPVVGAFHNLAAGRLADLDADLDVDTLVVGNEAAAKERVTALAESIDGLRAVDAGPLANSSEIEGITPLLINVAMNNEGMHDLGVRFE